MDTIMYNLPFMELETGREMFWKVVKEHFQDKNIDILEIGVFKGKCISMLPEGLLNINSYTGVDPYLGEKGDPYLNSYWKDKQESKSVYDEAKEVFEKRGAQLIRKTSKDFFEENEKKYDFIFVDGDHGYFPELWDMCHWFTRVKEDGLMMVDDYGNVDSPMVTKAVNSFCAICRPTIGRMGFFDKMFINTGKYIPVVSRYVYFEKCIKGVSSVYTVNNGSSARIGVAEKVIFDKQIVIWGAGNVGREILEMNPKDISFIIDSNKEKEGEKIGGKSVVHPDTIKNWKDYFVLVAGPKEIQDILAQEGMVRGIDYHVV